MNTVLVTGGAGYIGSHTCKALAAAGYLPVVYDNLIHGYREAVRWGPFERGDIGDRARLRSVIETHRPGAVIHFAAFAYVGESVAEPERYYLNNVAAALSLLQIMRECGLDKMVFSSSCATYGVPASMPITEATPQAPISPYGRSKLFLENVLADYEKAYGFRSMVLRYFNAAGCDPEGEIGEDHTPETHLVPLVLDAALGKCPPVVIFGDDYDTPDGTCVRDYVHVSDLADAHVRALQAMENGHPSRAFNLGNGDGFSVRQVIQTAEEVIGKEVPTLVGPRRPGDPPILVCDATAVRSLLGWQPKIPGLPEIIRTAWEWRRQRDRR